MVRFVKSLSSAWRQLTFLVGKIEEGEKLFISQPGGNAPVHNWYFKSDSDLECFEGS